MPSIWTLSPPNQYHSKIVTVTNPKIKSKGVLAHFSLLLWYTWKVANNNKSCYRNMMYLWSAIAHFQILKFLLPFLTSTYTHRHTTLSSSRARWSVIFVTVCVFVDKRVCAVLFLSVWFAGTVCCWESESSCWWSDRTLIWTSRNNTRMTLWSPQLSVCLLVTILADVSRAFGTYAMECIKVFINPVFTRARHVLT